MSTLPYKRRTKGTEAEMVNVFTSEEPKIYFKDEYEWRLASRIYWERHAIRGHIKYYLNKYNLTVTYYNYLMRQYSKFMLHKYQSNK
jgi:hypothetical protein